MSVLYLVCICNGFDAFDRFWYYMPECQWFCLMLMLNEKVLVKFGDVAAICKGLTNLWVDFACICKGLNDLC